MDAESEMTSEVPTAIQQKHSATFSTGGREGEREEREGEGGRGRER